MIGTLGEIAIVMEEPNFAIINVGLFKVNYNEVLSKYCFYYFQTDLFKSYANSISSGTTQKYISLAHLRNLPILKADEVSIKIIASILSAIDAKIEAEENGKKALEGLFKSMLHHLMTGKIRVSNLNLEKIKEGYK